MGRCPTGTVPGNFPRGRKRGLQTDLQNEIVREIETLLECPSIADLDFEALEMAARRQSLRLAARALEQRLNTDTSDHVGPQLPCPCGGSAQYHGRHGKTFESALGPLHLPPPPIRAITRCFLRNSAALLRWRSSAERRASAKTIPAPEPGPAGRIRSRIVHSDSKRAVGAKAPVRFRGQTSRRLGQNPRSQAGHHRDGGIAR
jgi:hypothetical protein